MGVRQRRVGALRPVSGINLRKPALDFLDTARHRSRLVVNGHDFVASPRLSPDGRRLAWLARDHPNMPWNGTILIDRNDRSTRDPERRLAAWVAKPAGLISPGLSLPSVLDTLPGLRDDAPQP